MNKRIINRLGAFAGLAWLLFLASGRIASGAVAAHGHEASVRAPFPPPLESYGDAGVSGLWDILANRVEQQPFNLWATVLFFGAILHTFLTHRFRHIAHALEHRHQERLRQAEASGQAGGQRRICGTARIFHFLGEVEAVFGIWIIPVLVLMELMVGEDAVGGYINERVNFTEPIFVVVIMAMASTRPILRLAENMLRLVARLGGEKPAAWWFALLTVGPLLGSFITEPGAMTICASLLSRRFYVHKPGTTLAYGTLGLLFVAVSVGGTLTHFAAPPVLMVVDAWGWNMAHMLQNFGWKAALGVVLSATAYYVFFRKELGRLGRAASDGEGGQENEIAIPVWVTVGHVLFMAFAVRHSHDPAFLTLTMLFFLAFIQVTEDFQSDFSLRPPVLVGFFLGGLVIHGGLQQWWIAPVLGRLGELPLMIGATVLTGFNDNAAITYLCTLVPTFTAGLKYMAVAGAVTGGGLTVIANAPNPAGQTILNKHFEDGVGALGLFLAALVPTIIAGLCFVLLR
jgi:Putative Na+/H+ antiporter